MCKPFSMKSIDRLILDNANEIGNMHFTMVESQYIILIGLPHDIIL